MFNKFTTKSQEAIINAQIIAGECGQPNIEALHLLASLLDQDESLVKPILEKAQINPEKVRDEVYDAIEKMPRTSTRGAQSFSDGNVGTVSGSAEAAYVLERAKGEADKMKDEFISTEHILLALIGIKTPAQFILLKAGLEYGNILKILTELRGGKKITEPDPEVKYKVLEKYTVDLTEMARNKKLDPVIGRDTEIRRIMQVLLRRTKNNPVFSRITCAGVFIPIRANKICSVEINSSFSSAAIFPEDSIVWASSGVRYICIAGEEIFVPGVDEGTTVSPYQRPSVQGTL